MNPADMLARLSSWAELANAAGLGLAIALLAPLCIAVILWAVLPRFGASARRDADIARQIASLRRIADKDVTHRPRMRSAPPKPCGGGLCRKRIDCHDQRCPGVLEARLEARLAARSAAKFQ